VARKNLALETRGQIRRWRAQWAFSLNPVRRAWIAAHYWARWFHVAADLVNSWTLARRRDMSTTQNGLASRDNWRADHRVVPKMPAL